uniref:Uncharacterized protein n=1 Tax=Oryza glumipatula TaxID=40148 RepID=A0A0E0BC15_9ORYZ
MVSCFSHQPERDGGIEQVAAMGELLEVGIHGAVDLVLEVVVDAEALQVVDGGHPLPAAVRRTTPLTPPLMQQHLLHVVRQAIQALHEALQMHAFPKHKRLESQNSQSRFSTNFNHF